MPAPLTEYDLGHAWFTPGYLARHDMDVWMLCAPRLARDCAYRAFWKHEELVERFGGGAQLDVLPWRCPSCGGRRVTWSVSLRAAQFGPEPVRALYVVIVAPG